MDFFAVLKSERHGGEVNLRVLLEDCITVVAVNKGVIPDDQRRKQLALFEDVFFKLLVLIVRQRRNLILELRVDFQIDHTHTPLSLAMLRLFFLPEEQDATFCFAVFSLSSSFFGFLVLLVELGLFGGKLRSTRLPAFSGWAAW